MANNPSPTERVTGQMSAEMDAQTQRLVTKLQSEFAAPDRANASSQTWQAVIRQNWDDPMWRQQQSVRMGPTAFVNYAMTAFGLDPKTLKNMPIPSMPGLPPPDPNSQPSPADPNTLPTQPPVPGAPS